MIRTLDYGMLPIATDTTYVLDDILGIIDTCNGDTYEIRRSFSGSLVAVKINQ